MKHIFLGAFILFGIMYLGALLTMEEPPEDVVPLRWATDPNPARDRQVATFQDWASDNNIGDVTVTVESGAMEKLIAQAATGVGPDIIDVYSIQQMQGFVEAGILMDLTPYADQYGFGPDNTYPKLRDALFVGDRQYRFPCNVAVNCVIYNTEIFDIHGVPYPEPDWTYDDFIEIGRQLQQPGPDGEEHLPFGHFNPSGLLKDFLVGHGATLFREHGLLSNLDSPEAIAAMQLYHDLMYEHGIIPPPEVVASMTGQGGWGGGGGGGLTWFSTERAAMIVIGRWYLNLLPNYPGIADHLATVELPRVEGRESQAVIDARAAGISVNAKHPEAALHFLQYLAGEPYNQLIVKDGDSLPPNPDYAETGEDLVMPLIQRPEWHQPFIDAAEKAAALDKSPFIDALLVDRWMDERRSRAENYEEIDIVLLMEDMAREINLRIRRNLQRQKSLQRKFEEVTGREYTVDWWREYEPAEVASK